MEEAMGVFRIVLPETDEAGSQVLVNRLLRLIRSHYPLGTEGGLELPADVLSFQTFIYPEKFMIP